MAQTLKERIAKLNAAAQGEQKEAPAALAPGELRKRRELYERGEGDGPLLPRGSFGAGAPSTPGRAVSGDRNRIASGSSSSYLPTSAFGANEPKLRSVSSSNALNELSTDPITSSPQKVHTRDPSEVAGLRGYALMNEKLNLSTSSSSLGLPTETGLRTPGSVSSMQVETGSLSSSAGTASAFSQADMTAQTDLSHMVERPHTPVEERDADVPTPPAPSTPVAEVPHALDEERAVSTAEALEQYENEETDKTRKPDDALLARSPDMTNETGTFTADDQALPPPAQVQIHEELDRLNLEQSAHLEEESGRLSPATSPTKSVRIRRVSSASSSYSASRRASKIVPEIAAGGEDETDLADTSLDKLDNPTPDQTPQTPSTARFAGPTADEHEEKEDISDLHPAATVLAETEPTSPVQLLRTSKSSNDSEFPSTVSEEGNATYDILDGMTYDRPDSIPIDAVEEEVPKVKCSDCNADVSLFDLADHVCSPRKPPIITEDPASDTSSSRDDSADFGTIQDLPRDLSRRDLDELASGSASNSPILPEFPQPPATHRASYMSQASTDSEQAYRRGSNSRTASINSLNSLSSPTTRTNKAFTPPPLFDEEDESEPSTGFVSIIKRSS